MQGHPRRSSGRHARRPRPRSPTAIGSAKRGARPRPPRPRPSDSDRSSRSSSRKRALARRLCARSRAPRAPIEQQAGALESAWDDERRARLALAAAGEGNARRIGSLEGEVRTGLDREADLRTELERLSAELSEAHEHARVLLERVEELGEALEQKRARSSELAARLGYEPREHDRGNGRAGRVEARLAEIARSLDAARRALSKGG
jgi:chromosome segregation ATPase